MPLEVTNRFIDPIVLAQLSSLELIAQTVVDGFVSGLHRSPDFGFSQEFAEYRAYTPGDDLRHVDWNVYARTERAYLKRYRGETNTTLMVLLDVSGSMSFKSGALSKLDYAKFVASALVYLAHLQRDGTGLIVFADEVHAVRAAFLAAGPVKSHDARNRSCGTGKAHGFQQTVRPLARSNEAAGNYGLNFGFL